jgi:hypothetical protein
MTVHIIQINIAKMLSGTSGVKLYAECVELFGSYPVTNGNRLWEGGE